MRIYKVPNSVIPRQMRTRLPYVHSASISTIGASGGGQAFDYSFNGNDIFDPDFSGGGHQPRGHDQWAVFYQKYFVHSCTASVKVSNTTYVGDEAGVLSLHQNDSTVPSFAPTSAMYDNLERMRDPKLGCVWKHVAASPTTSGKRWDHVGKKFYTGTWLSEHSFEERSGVIGNPPSVSNKIHVQMRTHTSVGVKTFRLEVTLIYDVTLYDPKSFVGS